MMKLNGHLLWGASILLATLPAEYSQAATVLGVTIEQQSASFNASRGAINMINGSGFTEATGFHSSAGGDNISWTGASSTLNPLPHFVTFDLESNYDLGSVKVWNWNTSSSLSAGSKDIDISVASSIGGAFTSLGSFVLTIGPGAANVDFGQVIDLSSFPAADNTRLVRIDVKSNHGFTTVAGLAGISEVRFDGVAAIPEPSVIALALGSLACLGRRRRA